MENIIKNFNTKQIDEASIELFNYLGIPLNRPVTDPISLNEIFGLNVAFNIIDTAYMIGSIDDNIFNNINSNFELKAKRYDSVLIFAFELNKEKPTRTELSQIARIFNRNFQYTPIILLFKYEDKISLANTQRQEYSKNQKWRGGEKIGKVSILRDIDIETPHRGHLDILDNMKITSKINSYETLYTHWQEVFDVSILNKSFYKELQNWYFWTLKENNVRFPNAPKGLEEDAETQRHEHNAKNVIRLLTRLLFVWFIKEKGLIPNELFDEEYIKNNLLKEFDPQKAEGLFKDSNKDSKYYKGILQNLFFATLNQEMGKRAFRNQKQHRNITNLMRYENYFKNPKEFITLVEKVVPFMNGGLFECLDKPHPTLKSRQGGEVIVYEDGFSDRADNELVVPDYIFFGLDNNVDLSSEYGTKGKINKNIKVKGLLKILESYKFTVTENTPIDEDVALDPELLGKVFENLLASYNPETKTTARKQTGSFYTPREIVSYMVDESLISYLKTHLENDFKNKDELDEKLHILLSFNDENPFENNQKLTKKIITLIDKITILDPAVGSGAFPMGALQKMVHLLTKLDPKNRYWEDLQLEKARKETNDAFNKNKKEDIKEKVDEIMDAFNDTINYPDYARKLYLIENCIFGVDIQPIAIQISKLRFFISLVVEQKTNNDKDNFGIRPLPNLESKFVTANTLIGIDKKVDNLFELDTRIQELEDELKVVRHKVFNTKVPKRKRELKEEDKNLREQIADELVKVGFETTTAKMLSDWDPYDQNATSPFFDKEWMFGIEDGFDIVIGNPPYIDSESMVRNTPNFREKLKQLFVSAKGNWDIFVVFIEKSILLTKTNGATSLIVPNKLISAKYTQKLRAFMNEYNIVELIDYSYVNVFTEADVYPIVFRVINNNEKHPIITKVMDSLKEVRTKNIVDKNIFSKDIFWDKYFFDQDILEVIIYLSKFKSVSFYDFDILGAATVNEAYQVKEILTELSEQKEYLKFINTGTIDPYESLWGVKNTQYIKGAYNYPIIDSDSLKSINETRYEQAISPKIIIAGMAVKLEAFLDQGEYLAGKSTTIVLAEELYLKTLTAILNSSTVSFWFSKYYNSLSMAGGYFNMGRNEISSIPIPDLYTIDLKLFNFLVECIIYMKTKETNIDNIHLIANYINKILNGMVFELYFEEHMKEKDINVLEFIKEDIKNIVQNKIFEDLNDSEKLEIINSLYSKWIDPDNEVRNRLKLFAVRSPNILKPILESQ